VVCDESKSGGELFLGFHVIDLGNAELAMHYGSSVATILRGQEEVIIFLCEHLQKITPGGFKCEVQQAGCNFRRH
jgi:hypothetical protein